MGYTDKSSLIQVGKSITKTLLDSFNTALVDHEAEITSLQANSSAIQLVDYYLSPEDLGIGEIKQAVMSLTEWQDLHGTGWVLCDGTTYTNSVYHRVTGSAIIPDFMTSGKFMRSALTDVVGGSAGQVGSSEADATAINGLSVNNGGSHNHTGSTGLAGQHSHTYTNSGVGANAASGSSYSAQIAADNTSTVADHVHAIPTQADHGHGLSGDLETKPTNINVNYFIKINLSATEAIVRVKVRENVNITSHVGYIVSHNGDPAAGSFTFDIKVGSIGSLSSIFSTKPTLTGAASDGTATSSGTVSGTTNELTAGDWIQVDITEYMTGQSGVYIRVFGTV